MRCPSLTELPPSPPDRIGWPWTEESPQLPDIGPDGMQWPRVSIVTPSYNQAQFIEETIRSVLLQGYPDLEYMVIDGGSTDGSVEIIRRYEPWLTYWVSEKDKGQTGAINKGWAKTSGQLLAWINSDDWYKLGALHAVASAYVAHPYTDVVYGHCRIVDSTGRARTLLRGDFTYDMLVNYWRTETYYGISQQAAFFARHLVQRNGLLDERLDYIMDYEYYLRSGPAARYRLIDQTLACFRHQTESKTMRSECAFAREHVKVGKAYARQLGSRQAREYVGGLKVRYARILITSLVHGSRAYGWAPWRVVASAVMYDPELLRVHWVRMLWLRTIIGNRLYLTLRELRNQLVARFRSPRQG